LALTDDERAAVRYHLGYLATRRGVSVGLGNAHLIILDQAVTLAMVELDPIHEPDVRALLQRMDEIECQKEQVSKTFATRRVEGIEFAGEDAIDALNRLYREAGYRLADLLSVKPNPQSMFWGEAIGGSSMGGCVREGGW